MQFRAVVVSCFLLSSVLGATLAQDGVAGDAGLGDSLFPLSGNGGYDVQAYTIELSWNDQDDSIEAITTLEATATLDLNSFNLDFSDFEITDLTVNDVEATYSRDGLELSIVPESVLAKDEPFTVVVAYQGIPVPFPEAGLPIEGIGWNRYEGGVFTLSQVTGSPSWFPVNDHPNDPATFTFRITVPQPYSVVANGLLEEVISEGDSQTFVWQANDPMVSYLATVNIGEFDVEEKVGEDGLPIINYFFKGATEEQRSGFARQAEIIAFFSDIYGPYPFEAAGAVLLNQEIGAALETQTRPLHDLLTTGEDVVVHEIAHQWFGNSVRVADWSNIWLNEGFASYSEALWAEHAYGQEAFEAAVRSNYSQGVHGVLQVLPAERFLSVIDGLANAGMLDTSLVLSTEQVQTIVDDLLHGEVDASKLEAALASIPAEGLPVTELSAFLLGLEPSRILLVGEDLTSFFETLGIDPAVVGLSTAALVTAPGVVNEDNLFNLGVYRRGASTLHALRLLVGDDLFFQIVRTYYQEFAGQSATIPDFIEVAERVSNQELDDFFQAWLYAPTAPDIPELGLYAEDVFSALGE